jgi:hypothetical protein
MAGKDVQWTVVYETVSPSDADLVRTTLEVAGYRVSIEGAPSSFLPSYDTPGALTVAVPSEDADDARDFLKHKTSLVSQDDKPPVPPDDSSAQPESLAEVTQEILEMRRQHEVAACKYCGIATLDVGEIGLDSRTIALLRSAGLGVNSATFSEFAPGERICTDCAGHEVSCERCGRVLDAYLDGGDYRRANDDEAYVCSECRGRLEDQLQPVRDW